MNYTKKRNRKMALIDVVTWTSDGGEFILHISILSLILVHIRN